MARRHGRSDSAEPNIAALSKDFSRLKPKVQLTVLTILVVAGLVGLFTQNRASNQRTAHAQQSPNSLPASSPVTQSDSRAANLLLGNPSGATQEPANKDNFLMIKPFFALSYNDSKGTPNWVSWRVARSD